MGNGTKEMYALFHTFDFIDLYHSFYFCWSYTICLCYPQHGQTILPPSHKIWPLNIGSLPTHGHSQCSGLEGAVIWQQDGCEAEATLKFLQVSSSLLSVHPVMTELKHTWSCLKHPRGSALGLLEATWLQLWRSSCSDNDMIVVTITSWSGAWGWERYVAPDAGEPMTASACPSLYCFIHSIFPAGWASAINFYTFLSCKEYTVFQIPLVQINLHTNAAMASSHIIRKP